MDKQKLLLTLGLYHFKACDHQHQTISRIFFHNGIIKMELEIMQLISIN